MNKPNFEKYLPDGRSGGSNRSLSARFGKKSGKDEVSEHTAIFSKPRFLSRSADDADDALASSNASDKGSSAKAGSGFLASLKRIFRKNKLRGGGDDEPSPVFVPRKRPHSTVLAVFFGIIKLMILSVLIGGVTVFGLVLGIAKAYIDTTPSLDIPTLTVSDRTSYIYDSNGDMLTTFASMEYRDWVNIEDVPDMLKDALIAVEDVRFYKHGGLDFKRLFGAVVNTFLNANTHGGSTITQQLIKIKILSDVQSYKRKIQEAYLAYELESTISKDDILEAYMNDVYLGDSNYGFKTAAKDYFGKELSQLTIRECAMLAGMVQKPNVYNPRANTYRRFNEDGSNKMSVTNERTDIVLQSMYKAGFITKTEYQRALKEKVDILEKSAQKQFYDMAYFVEYATYDIVTHMLQQRGLADTSSNRSAIERELRTGGYHIYLTVDPDVQNGVQSIITNWEDYPHLRNSAASEIIDPISGIVAEQPQASAVIIDHRTGQIKAIIGGREEPLQRRQLNRAYQSSMPVGSSIKPLTVYGPALDMGASPATGILNAELEIDGYGGNGYPAIGSSRWEGIIPIRRGVVSSLNIVAARTLFDIVTPDLSAKYLERLGVDRSRINVDGPGLALGTSGITPLEMAAAYACIANGGVYLEPMSFSRVVADDGTVVLNASEIQKSYRVYEETTAYMLTDMLKDVVSYGTGTHAQIDGITVAGKTGTNDDYTSVYFAGFTGYYTASLWIGHDRYSEKLASGSTGGNSAAPLWQAFMSDIHEGLSDRPLLDVSPSDIGLVKTAICPVSGLLATDECMLDTYNPPITDWVAVDKMPSQYCTMHCGVDFCIDSDMPASVECPRINRVEKCVVLINSESLYARLPDELLYAYIPNAIRTELGIVDYIEHRLESESSCIIHGGFNANVPIGELLERAGALIAEVRSYLDTVQTLSDTDRALLESGIANLQAAIAQTDVIQIQRCMQELMYNYNILSSAHPPVTDPNPSLEPEPSPGTEPTPEPTPSPNE